MLANLEVYGQWIRSNPAGFAVYMLYFVVAVLISLILHECAHGWVALQCGDPTAKMLGRLSLDPRRHLDPIGTACMFLLGFGWAKPVPVNPRNYRNYRQDEYLVSVAGITVNLTLFIVCTGLSVLVNRLMVSDALYARYSDSVAGKTWLYAVLSSNIAYGQAPVLTGELAKWVTVPWLQYVQRFLVMMRSINLTLAVFNLLPIPPLDGFRLLNNLLKGRFRISAQTAQMTRVLLFALCMTGMLGKVLGIVTGALDDAVVNLFMLI